MINSRQEIAKSPRQAAWTPIMQPHYVYNTESSSSACSPRVAEYDNRSLTISMNIFIRSKNERIWKVVQENKIVRRYLISQVKKTR